MREPILVTLLAVGVDLILALIQRLLVPRGMREAAARERGKARPITVTGGEAEPI